MKKIRHFIEYVLARILLFIFDFLPYRLTSKLAIWAGNLWWWFDRGRRKVAIKNILRSGIESDPKRARAIAKKSIQNFGVLILESLKSSKILDSEDWKAHIKFNVHPEVYEVLKDPDQGLIFAGGHLGNWEIGGHLFSHYKPVAGIVRPMNNPLIERIIKKRKGRYQFRPIPKNDSKASRLIDVLNEKNILALLFDQHAHSHGEMIDFFGHPASTHKTIALLHLVTKAPICYAECIRTGSMKFEVNSLKPIRHTPTGNKKEDVRTILNLLNQHLENSIRKAPDQYLWAHRRWRD